MRLNVLMLAACCSLPACGPGPIDNSTWTLSVAADVLVHERPFVAPDDPTRAANLVEMEREWTAGDKKAASGQPEADDDRALIYRARRASVDRFGRSWVMDFGDSHLKIFDQGGRFVAALAGRGRALPSSGLLRSTSRRLAIGSPLVTIRTAGYRFGISRAATSGLHRSVRVAVPTVVTRSSTASMTGPWPRHSRSAALPRPTARTTWGW